MAKHILNRLSARAVAAEKKPGVYRDGGGLLLVITRTGHRKWIFRYVRNGKATDLGLGSARDVTLADARERAAGYRAALAKGESPRAIHERKVIPTFGEAADRYIARQKGEWKNAKHLAQWKMTLREYAAPLRPKPVNEIGVSDVLAVLEPLWTTKPETARRLRQRIEAVLDAEIVAGHRSDSNPARYRGFLDKRLRPMKKLRRGHHEAMPYADVPAFFGKLRTRQATAAAALEFLILCASRTGEIIGARWPEIDMAQKLWTIPPERMKGDREHRAPLSDPALAILKDMAQLRRGDDPDGFVFPGLKRGKPLSNMAMEMLLRRLDVEVTVHGFRSSFRDWAGDVTSFPREVIEAALAHTIENKTEAAYRRGDALEKRRQLMTAWAAHVTAAPAKNVVALKRPSA